MEQPGQGVVFYVVNVNGIGRALGQVMGIRRPGGNGHGRFNLPHLSGAGHVNQGKAPAIGGGSQPTAVWRDVGRSGYRGQIGVILRLRHPPTQCAAGRQRLKLAAVGVSGFFQELGGLGIKTILEVASC